MKFHQFGVPAVTCFGWSGAQSKYGSSRKSQKGVVFLPDADKRKSVIGSTLLG